VRFIFSIDWWLKQCFFTLEYLQCSSTYQCKAYQPFFFTETFCLFLAETFWSLKHFSRLSHSCIKTCCNSVFCLFRASDRNDLIFLSFWKRFSLMTKKKQLTSLFERAVQCYILMPATNWVISFGSTPQHSCFQIPSSRNSTLHHWIFFTCLASWSNPMRNCCVFI